MTLLEVKFDSHVNGVIKNCGNVDTVAGLYVDMRPEEGSEGKLIDINMEGF